MKFTEVDIDHKIS